MRTTLSLDDDVAALLERIQKATKKGLKETVNEGLRRGLKLMESPTKPGKSFRTRSVSLGRCLLGSIDDVAEVLAVAEGERLR